MQDHRFCLGRRTRRWVHQLETKQRGDGSAWTRVWTLNLSVSLPCLHTLPYSNNTSNYLWGRAGRCGTWGWEQVKKMKKRVLTILDLPLNKFLHPSKLAQIWQSRTKQFLCCLADANRSNSNQAGTEISNCHLHKIERKIQVPTQWLRKISISTATHHLPFASSIYNNYRFI